MRILCPTDFSPSAINGIEYAAHLAQQLDATITLMHVQSLVLSASISLDTIPEKAHEIENENISKLLHVITTEIENRFKISCSYEVIPSQEKYENVIAQKTSEFDLTIIGTNGADNLNQFYFGSHSFRMVKNANAPVIIVPEDASFNEYQNIVFASDYSDGDLLLLKQLKEFTKIFNPNIHVLHVSKEDTPLTSEIYKSFCRLIEDAFYFSNKIYFKRLIAENPAIGIETYLNKTNSNLLTLFYQEHNVLYKMFHENLIKKITSYADFPVLIFHE